MRLDRLWSTGAFACGLMALAASSAAQDLNFSATVDKTTVAAGEPITLTLTLSGDLEGLKLPTPTFPQEFAVGGQSQSTNFSMRAGVVERSMSLAYVLIPQHEGTFTLGPFTVEHQKKELETAPIEITVKKSILPPKPQPQGERFTL